MVHVLSTCSASRSSTFSTRAFPFLYYANQFPITACRPFLMNSFFLFLQREPVWTLLCCFQSDVCVNAWGETDQRKHTTETTKYICYTSLYSCSFVKKMCSVTLTEESGVFLQCECVQSNNAIIRFLLIKYCFQNTAFLSYCLISLEAYITSILEKTKTTLV